MLPEITRNMYSDPKLSMADQTRWFESIEQSAQVRYWIIELESPCVPVGVLSLSDIDTLHRRCSWAYYIAESDARGRGLGKTLECNIYDYVLMSMDFNRLWCEVMAFNDRVVRLHELFGSKVEGVLRQHICKGGVFHDVVRMAVLKDEWLMRRNEFQYTTIEIE